MGIGRAHDAHVELVRKSDIANEMAPPGDPVAARNILGPLRRCSSV